MITTFGQKTNDNFHCSGPFIPFVTDGKMSVRGGEIISISPQKKIQIETKPDIEADEDTGAIEAYLHIKSDPISSQISEANILSIKEVKLRKEKSDNLLNIYIPIARAAESRGEVIGIEEADNINTNFLWLKQNREKPFACYFDYQNGLGKVYTTGYMLQENLDEEHARPSSSTFIPEDIEGKFFAVYFSVNATTSIGGLAGINATKFNLDFVNKDEIKSTASSVEYTSEDIFNYYELPDRSEQLAPWVFKGSLESVMPIGYIQDSNFVHCRPPSNVELGIGFTTVMDYIGTYTQGDCVQPNYKYTRTYFLKAI